MKRIASNLFYLFVLLCLIGIIADWFFHFDQSAKSFLRTLMFSLIGIAFLASGYSQGEKWKKIIFALCGVYLLSMSFIPDFEAKGYIAIVAMIIPLYIEKAFSEPEKEDKLAEK